MSIEQTRHLLEKPGCKWTATLLLGGAMAASLLGSFRGCSDGGAQQAAIAAEEDKNQPKILTLKESSIPVSAIESAYTGQIDQQDQQGRAQAAQKFEDYEGIPLEERVRFMGQISTQIPLVAATMQLAKENKIDLSEEGIRKVFQSFIDDSLKQNRAELIKQGKIKENATQEEFDKAFKETGGKTRQEQVDEQAAQLQQALADPNRRFSIINMAAQNGLQKLYESKVTVSEDEIKRQFNNYKFKQITFTQKPGEKETAKEKAERVLKEIKGGLSFEAAMDKYSSASPPKGKKLSDDVSEFPGGMIEMIPAFKPLATLKKDEVSDVIEGPGGISILKLVGITTTMPPDYEKTKEQYRETAVRQQAGEKLRKDAEALAKDSALTWNDTGFKVLSEVSQYVVGEKAQAPDQKTQLATLVKTAGEEAKARPSRAAAYAYFMAADALYNAPTGAVTAMKDTYYEAVKVVLSLDESPTLRLKLVQYLLDKKDPSAGEQLATAAASNNTYGTRGQANQQLIYSLLDKLKAAKLTTPELEKTIEDAQKTWIENKKQFDQSLRDAKLAEEKAKKEAEEAQKKAEAEQKAAEAKDKKDVQPPTTSSSDLVNPPKTDKP